MLKKLGENAKILWAKSLVLFRKFVAAPTEDAANARHLFRFFLLCAAVFFVFFGVTFVFLLRSSRSVQLPNLVGRDLVVATKELQDRKLRVILAQKYSIDIPRYQVIAQQPEPGAMVRQNRGIVVTVSLGKKAALMPDFHNKNINEARSELLELFSAYEKVPNIIETQKASGLEQGTVLEQTPGPKEPVPLDRDILFVVSKGAASEELTAENYVMKNFKDVSASLKAQGIEVRVDFREAARSQDVGKIFVQSISAGSPLRRGDTITFFVGAERGFSSDKARELEVLRVYSFQVPVSGSDSTPAANTNADKKKKRTVAKKRKIQIRVHDQFGEETVLTRDAATGDYLDLPYKTVGKGYIEVLVDGELYAKENFQ